MKAFVYSDRQGKHCVLTLGEAESCLGCRKSRVIALAAASVDPSYNDNDISIKFHLRSQAEKMKGIKINTAVRKSLNTARALRATRKSSDTTALHHHSLLTRLVRLARPGSIVY